MPPMPMQPCGSIAQGGCLMGCGGGCCGSPSTFASPQAPRGMGQMPSQSLDGAAPWPSHTSPAEAMIGPAGAAPPWFLPQEAAMTPSSSSILPAAWAVAQGREGRCMHLSTFPATWSATEAASAFLRSNLETVGRCYGYVEGLQLLPRPDGGFEAVVIFEEEAGAETAAARLNGVNTWRLAELSKNNEFLPIGEGEFLKAVLLSGQQGAGNHGSPGGQQQVSMPVETGPAPSAPAWQGTIEVPLGTHAADARTPSAAQVSQNDGQHEAFASEAQNSGSLKVRVVVPPSWGHTEVEALVHRFGKTDSVMPAGEADDGAAFAVTFTSVEEAELATWMINGLQVPTVSGASFTMTCELQGEQQLDTTVSRFQATALAVGATPEEEFSGGAAAPVGQGEGDDGDETEPEDDSGGPPVTVSPKRMAKAQAKTFLRPRASSARLQRATPSEPPLKRPRQRNQGQVLVEEAKILAAAGELSKAYTKYCDGIDFFFSKLPHGEGSAALRREVEGYLREAADLKSRMEAGLASAQQQAVPAGSSAVASAGLPLMPSLEEAIEQCEALLKAARTADANGLSEDAQSSCRLAIRLFLRTMRKVVQEERHSVVVIKRVVQTYLARPGFVITEFLEKAGLSSSNLFGLLPDPGTAPPKR